jgi:tripartite-type tricarboxylate transporter receptor subunit TctC
MRRGVYIILVLSFFLATLCLACADRALAFEKPKDYPKRPVELVIPSGPGGGSDLFARSFAKDVEKTLGVPIKYSFMPGSATAIGTNYAMDQEADGYTLMLVYPDTLLNIVFGRIKYGIGDFTWLAKGVHSVSTIHTRVANKKFQSIKDIQEHFKKHPKERLTVGGSGVLTMDHAFIELLNKRGKMSLKYVPFDSSGERKASFQGGHTTFESDEPQDMEGLYKAGISRPILVAYTQRLGGYPDVPCSKELGIDVYLGKWRGVALKAGTPEPIAKYLEWAFAKSFRTEGYQKYLKKEAPHERGAASYAGLEDFRKFVVEEQAMFNEIAKDLGWIKK